MTGRPLADNLRVAHRRTAWLDIHLLRPRRDAPPIGGVLALAAGRRHQRHLLPCARDCGRRGRCAGIERHRPRRVHPRPRQRRTAARGDLRRDDSRAARQRAHPRGVRLRSTPPTGISNSGAIPGFTAYMQYDPTTEDLFVLLLNNDSRSPEQLGTASSKSSSRGDQTTIRAPQRLSRSHSVRLPTWTFGWGMRGCSRSRWTCGTRCTQNRWSAGVFGARLAPGSGEELLSSP